MTQSSSPPDRFQLELASKFEHLERAVEEAEAFFRHHIEDTDRIYQLLLVTSEAITNAMRHGNQLEASKRVLLNIDVQSDQIEITVEDEGQGFERKKIEDPLAEENLLREGGRGLFLIEQMADEVVYEQGGRRVRMIFGTDE